MLRLVRKHRRIAWVAGIVTVVGLAFVIAWFQPQKLFIEKTVTESLPGLESAQKAPAGKASPTGVKPVFLAEGMFRSLEHPTSGTAQILELSDGSRFLRFEGLDTSNGPDLRVYLSQIPASDDWYAYGERFIDLGALKGNRGDQNYAIPDETDLSKYKSAVIWCRRFTVGFGVAPLA